MYRHKKQTGGAGQFAEVHLRVDPLPPAAFRVRVGGLRRARSRPPSSPPWRRASIRCSSRAVISGYPVVDVKAAITDGKEHRVDSKDIAFQVAGREAFKLAVQGAGPKPRADHVPRDRDPGGVRRRRHRDLNYAARPHLPASKAAAGAARERQGAAGRAAALRTDLTSMTGGRGQSSMELDHYEEVPSQIAREDRRRAPRARRGEEILGAVLNFSGPRGRIRPGSPAGQGFPRRATA